VNQHTAGTQTECLHGHPYPQFRGRDHRGHSVCLACQERWRAEHRARLQAEAAERRAQRGPLVDEAILERVRLGERVRSLTTPEKRLAVEILDRRGLSARLIAERIGCAQRTVNRLRARRRQTDTAWVSALAELGETSA
jgi:hypothetical protein